MLRLISGAYVGVVIPTPETVDLVVCMSLRPTLFRLIFHLKRFFSPKVLKTTAGSLAMSADTSEIQDGRVEQNGTLSRPYINLLRT